MANLNLTEIFGAFAGREVSLISMPFEYRGRKYENFEIPFDEPTIVAMREIASQHGLSLRLKFPGYNYVEDEELSRVNAWVDKTADGGYKIGNTFVIG